MVCWRRLCPAHRHHAQACTSWASIPISVPPETRQECANVIARVACDPSERMNWAMVVADPPSSLRAASQASAAAVPSSSSGTDPLYAGDPAQGEWTWSAPTHVPVWRRWQRLTSAMMSSRSYDARQDANGQRDDQPRRRLRWQDADEADANPERAIQCRECHTQTTRICVTCGRHVCRACAWYHTMFCWQDVNALQRAVSRTEDTMIGSDGNTRFFF